MRGGPWPAVCGDPEDLSRPGYRDRAREWRVVTRLLRAAGAGRGGVLLVEGPSGIGKSRLLAEAVEAAAKRGFMIARGGADELAVPQVTFTEPEVGGPDRGRGRSRRDTDTRRRRRLSAVAGSALHVDGYRGHAHTVVDEDRKVIVGFTPAGPDVAELLHAATIAVVGEVPLDR